MELQWYGTATISIRYQDGLLLFDPYFPLNENIRCFREEEAARPEHILITHGHFDHLADVPAIVAKHGQTVHCSKTAAETLMKRGVGKKNIHVISPGDRLDIGPFTVRVLKGRHIRFNPALVFKTIFSSRMITYRRHVKKILAQHRRHPAGEMLIFEVKAGDARLLHLGSLNMDGGEAYPLHPEVMTIPFQGRSDLAEYALDFLGRIRPRAVYLHHFDDTFPPVSDTVDPAAFIRKAAVRFPGMKVIVPEYGRPVCT